MKVPYTVSFNSQTGAKELSWCTPADYSCDSPTLAELQEAARKEFPEVPTEELLIDAGGYDAEVITLNKKQTAS